MPYFLANDDYDSWQAELEREERERREAEHARQIAEEQHRIEQENAALERANAAEDRRLAAEAASLQAEIDELRAPIELPPPLPEPPPPIPGYGGGFGGGFPDLTTLPNLNRRAAPTGLGQRDRGSDDFSDSVFIPSAFDTTVPSSSSPLVIPDDEVERYRPSAEELEPFLPDPISRPPPAPIPTGDADMGVGLTPRSGILGTANPALVPNQFASGLSTAEAYAACGPAAAVAFARSQGRNPTMQEALELARQVGWNPNQGMAGPGSQVDLMNRMGVPTRLVSGNPNPSLIERDVGGNNPVIISTPNHYFVIDGFNQATGRYHVGNSGTAYRTGSAWMTMEEIRRVGGGIQGTIFLDNPGSPAPSVAAADRASTNPGQTLVLDTGRSVDATLGLGAESYDQPLSTSGPPQTGPEAADAYERFWEGVLADREARSARLAETSRAARDEIDRAELGISRNQLLGPGVNLDPGLTGTHDLTQPSARPSSARWTPDPGLTRDAIPYDPLSEPAMIDRLVSAPQPRPLTGLGDSNASLEWDPGRSTDRAADWARNQMANQPPEASGVENLARLVGGAGPAMGQRARDELFNAAPVLSDIDRNLRVNVAGQSIGPGALIETALDPTNLIPFPAVRGSRAARAGANLLDQAVPTPRIPDIVAPTWQRVTSALSDPSTPAADLPGLSAQVQGLRAIMDDLAGMVPERQIGGGTFGSDLPDDIPSSLPTPKPPSPEPSVSSGTQQLDSGLIIPDTRTPIPGGQLFGPADDLISTVGEQGSMITRHGTDAMAMLREMTEEERAGVGNLAKMAVGPDLKATLIRSAQEAGGYMDQRQGVITHEQTLREGMFLGKSVEEYLATPIGQAMNQNEITGVRLAAVKVAREIIRSNAAAAEKGGWAAMGAVEKAQLLSAMTQGQDLLGVVRGAKATAGRTISALNISISELLAQQASTGVERRLSLSDIEDAARRAADAIVDSARANGSLTSPPGSAEENLLRLYATRDVLARKLGYTSERIPLDTPPGQDSILDNLAGHRPTLQQRILQADRRFEADFFGATGDDASEAAFQRRFLRDARSEEAAASSSVRSAEDVTTGATERIPLDTPQGQGSVLDTLAGHRPTLQQRIRQAERDFEAEFFGATGDDVNDAAFQRRFLRDARSEELAASSAVRAEEAAMGRQNPAGRAADFDEAMARIKSKSAELDDLIRQMETEPVGGLQNATSPLADQSMKRAIAEANRDFDAAYRRAVQADEVGKQTEARRIETATKLLERMGGQKTVDSLLDPFMKTVMSGDDVAIAAFLRNYNKPTWRNRWDGLRYAGMLSATSTHMFNLVANLANSGLEQGLVRPTAIALDVARSRATGGPREMFWDELPAMAKGNVEGLVAGLRNAGIAMATGISPHNATRLDQIYPGMGISNPKVAFAAEYGVRLTMAIDELVRGMIAGKYVRKAADGTEKTLAGGQLRALAVREANKSMEIGGRASRDARADFIIEHLADFPDIARSADKYADRIVFQEHRPFTSGAVNLVASLPGAGGVVASAVVPFIRTPLNATIQQMEATILNWYGVLRSSMKAREARGVARGIEQALAGEGITNRATPRLLSAQSAASTEVVNAQTEAARMIVGTAISALGFYLGVNNLATGTRPENPGEANTEPSGWRPISLRVLGNDVDLKQFGTASGPMAAGIIAGEMVRKGEVDSEKVILAAANWGEFMLDQSALVGMNNFFNSLQDPIRYGTAAAGNILTQPIPFSGLLRQGARSAGVAPREADTVQDHLLAAVPGLAGLVPPKRDLFGEEKPPQSQTGLAAFISPIRYSPEVDDPARQELRGLGVGVSNLNPPTGTEPAAWDMDRYRQDAGQRLRVGINAALNDPRYTATTPDERREILRDLISGSRSGARLATGIIEPRKPGEPPGWLLNGRPIEDLAREARMNRLWSNHEARQRGENRPQPTPEEIALFNGVAINPAFAAWKRAQTVENRQSRDIVQRALQKAGSR